MNDTPRTTFRRIPVGATQALVPADCYTVMADHAEALERELNAMTAAKNKAVEALKFVTLCSPDNGGHWVPSHAIRHIETLLKELEEVK